MNFINGGTINFKGNSIASLAKTGLQAKPVSGIRQIRYDDFNDKSTAGSAKIVNTGQVIFKDNSGGRTNARS